jgi:pyrrolidone-carboxylate peptidase
MKILLTGFSPLGEMSEGQRGSPKYQVSNSKFQDPNPNLMKILLTGFSPLGEMSEGQRGSPKFQVPNSKEGNDKI